MMGIVFHQSPNEVNIDCTSLSYRIHHHTSSLIYRFIKHDVGVSAVFTLIENGIILQLNLTPSATKIVLWTHSSQTCICNEYLGLTEADQNKEQYACLQMSHLPKHDEKCIPRIISRIHLKNTVTTKDTADPSSYCRI